MNFPCSFSASRGLRPCTLWLLGWIVAAAMQAQAGQDVKQPASALHMDVNEMGVGLVAENSHTSPIYGLKTNDLRVRVDGHPVNLRALGTDANVPINITLLIDVSGSQAGMLAHYAEALQGLKQELQPGRDKVNIYTFGGSVRLYQDWTDVGALDVEALAHLDPKAGTVVKKSPWFLSGGTRLFDAVALAIANAKKLEGRKAILALTDGIDEGSTTTSGTALQAAEQGNVSICALEFYPMPFAVLSPAFTATLVHNSLAAISNASGGVFLHAHHGEEKEQIGEIVRLLKEEYFLYFAEPKVEPGRHELKIELVHPIAGASLRYQRRVWIGAR